MSPETETLASRWKKRVAVALVLALPLVLGVVGLVRDRSARAQETPADKPHADEKPGETHLTEQQEAALDVKLVVAKLLRGDHPIVSGGKVSLDIERTARVRPLLNSIIYEVKKHAGDEVKKGDELLVVESTDLGDAKNNYLTALANLDVAAETYKREALLRATRATTDNDYHAARAGFRTAVVATEAARQKCLLLGVLGRELDALEGELPTPTVREDSLEGDSGTGPLGVKAPDDKEREDDARLALREVARRRAHQTQASDEDSRKRARYTIRAPIDGTLLSKDAARGEYIDPSQVIATVSDLSQVWINVDVYQNDIAKVQIGAQVDVLTPTYADIAFTGSVTFISESVDETTHTLKARVVVDNPKRLLKNGMAAKTTVHCIDEKPRIELPPEAIVREGEDTYVIVKKGPGYYVRQRVKLGLEAQDAVHVDSGLVEGETVVLGGNLFIHTKIPLGD
jgi:multidrug efflux pump subunit AcrA (membrane-fusion protein)